MPSLVIGFIKPLIPKIETRTLVVMRTDIQEAYSLGDECDKKVWEAFREQIEREIDKRRERAYEPSLQRRFAADAKPSA
jgi:hypothetical protein